MRTTHLLAFIVTLFSSNNFWSQSDTVKFKAYGGPLFEEAAQLIEYSAGGYAVVGTTGGNQTGNTDVFVARFDHNLNCIWSNNFGGTNVEWASSITNDSNGNLMVCGSTLSEGAGGYDMWVIKVNSDGELVWQRTFGGSDWDFAKQIIPHPSGGFLVCGNSYSGGSGGQDGTLLHITEDGVLTNQRFFGGPGNDSMNDIVAVDDGYVACGHESIDNVMKSRVWRFNAGDDLIWERTDGDNSGADREAKAISADAGKLLIVGSITVDDTFRSFEQVIELDNTLSIEAMDLVEYDFAFLDCAFVQNQIYYAGFWTIWGYDEARLIRKHDDLIYSGSFQITLPTTTRFNSVISTSEGLVFSGSYIPPSSQNWQVFLLKYTSTNLASVSSNPQFFPCFSIGVEEENEQELITEGQLVNTLGKVVIDNFIWDPLMDYPQLTPGVYFIRKMDIGSVRRIWIGR